MSDQMITVKINGEWVGIPVDEAREIAGSILNELDRIRRQPQPPTIYIGDNTNRIIWTRQK